MAVAVLLASGVLPSLGYIHHIGQYAWRYLPSCCSTKICSSNPYTSLCCPDVWNMASHELPAESTSLSRDRWEHTNDLHTTRYHAHPREYPFPGSPSSSPLFLLFPCLTLEPLRSCPVASVGLPL